MAGARKGPELPTCGEWRATCITIYILQGREGTTCLSPPTGASFCASERKGQIASNQSDLPYMVTPSN
jgi:hypothetical protein